MLQYVAIFIGFILLHIPIVSWSSESLHFESKQLSFDVSAKAAEVNATYKFKNIGNKPINIIEVKTSCGCTTAQLLKRSYAPQEAGEIPIVFLVGERTGSILQKITVITDEAIKRETQLTLNVVIPDGPIISPRFLDWKLYDSNTPREVNVIFPPESAYTFKDVVCSNPHIKLTSFVKVSANHISFMVSPVDTTVKFSGDVNIITEQKIFRVYAQVVGAE